MTFRISFGRKGRIFGVIDKVKIQIFTIEYGADIGLDGILFILEEFEESIGTKRMALNKLSEGLCPDGLRLVEFLQPPKEQTLVSK
jgi:hypothetical protein